MSRKTAILVTVILFLAMVVGCLCYIGGHSIWKEELVTRTESISPDGMFRCKVVEQSNPGKVVTLVGLFERAKPFGENDSEKTWRPINEQSVYNDSAHRSNYSINWRYDDKHVTTGVVVFGDFGSAPFPGEIIFDGPVPARKPGSSSSRGD